MSEQNQTRVWWDGEEVRFIRWTEHALIFSWVEPTVTATPMPRGAVIRLVNRGVLRIEGAMPAWVPRPRDAHDAPPLPHHSQPQPTRTDAPAHPLPRNTHPRPAHPPAAPIDEPPLAAGDTQPLPASDSQRGKPDLVRTLGRLIRRLSGGSPRRPESIPR